MRAHNNLGVMLLASDHTLEALEQFESGLAAARARGDRPWELLLFTGRCAVLFILGRWDELAEACEPLIGRLSDDVNYAELYALYALLTAARGNLDALNALAPPMGSPDSADSQIRSVVMLGLAAVAGANGRSREALDLLRDVVRIPNPETRRHAYIVAGEAAWNLDDVAALEELIELAEQLPPVDAAPLMRAEAARFAGLLAAERGDLTAAERHLDEAIALMRELGYRYELGKMLLERGELLLETDRAADSTPFIDEARVILTALGAQPRLARAEQALASRPASAA